MSEEKEQFGDIIVETKHGEFHVHLKGKPGIRGQGKNIIIAVGTMVCDHPDAFDLTFDYDKADG